MQGRKRPVFKKKNGLLIKNLNDIKKYWDMKIGTGQPRQGIIEIKRKSEEELIILSK